MDIVLGAILLVIFGVVLFVAFKLDAALEKTNATKKQIENAAAKTEKQPDMRLETTKSEIIAKSIPEKTINRLRKHEQYAAISSYLVGMIMGFFYGINNPQSFINTLPSGSWHDGLICIMLPLYLVFLGVATFIICIPLGLLGGYIGYKMGDHLEVSITLGTLFGIGGSIGFGLLDVL